MAVRRYSVCFQEERWHEIVVPASQEYALVKFEHIADAQHAFYTLTAHASDEWVLDFEPLTVSFRGVPLAAT